MIQLKASAASPAAPSELLDDIRLLIEASRQRATSTVNAELTLLFWRIGHRIHAEVLAGHRAGYGEEIVPTLAMQLLRDYGRGFGEKNLRRMVKFAATFPAESIVATLSRQLSWSHFVLLLAVKEPMQREYYAQMAAAERWSVRTLRNRIDSMLYQRTALSKKPDALIAQELAAMRDAQRMSPALVMRDPYILDFLGLRDAWQEGDLEAAIIREMESFLLELGVGFTFVARQKRIQIDDKHEREPEESSPLGIILCAGKKSEQIELLELDKSGIHVAEYLTTLPPRAVLVERLHQATQRAQSQIESCKRETG